MEKNPGKPRSEILNPVSRFCTNTQENVASNCVTCWTPQSLPGLSAVGSGGHLRVRGGQDVKSSVRYSRQTRQAAEGPRSVSDPTSRCWASPQPGPSRISIKSPRMSQSRPGTGSWWWQQKGLLRATTSLSGITRDRSHLPKAFHMNTVFPPHEGQRTENHLVLPMWNWIWMYKNTKDILWQLNYHTSQLNSHFIRLLTTKAICMFPWVSSNGLFYNWFVQFKVFSFFLSSLGTALLKNSHHLFTRRSHLWRWPMSSSW